MKPWMTYLIGAVFVRRFAQVGVGQIVLSADSGVRFPKVKGQNLEGRKFNLPKDFEAKLNLVTIREVTITLYLDRTLFLKSIGETTDRTICTLLVNPKGEILWRGQDAYTKAQEDSLEKILKP
jgi:hypothetical protein